MRAKRKKRLRPVAGIRPWASVVLSVDPGDKCGVAIYNHGVYYDSAVGDGYDPTFIAMWIGQAVFVAQQCDEPLVLVLEKPPAGGRGFGNRSPLGAGSVQGSRKLWKKLWTKHTETVSRYVVDVYPPCWRSRVLGTIIDPQPRERLRAAIEKHGDASRAGVFSQDEAAAVCIGVWASNAPEVADVLPVKLRLCAS